MAEDRKIINDEELDQVTGGQGSDTGENETYFENLNCPFCNENSVYNLT